MSALTDFNLVINSTSSSETAYDITSCFQCYADDIHAQFVEGDVNVYFDKPIVLWVNGTSSHITGTIRIDNPSGRAVALNHASIAVGLPTPWFCADNTSSLVGNSNYYVLSPYGVVCRSYAINTTGTLFMLPLYSDISWTQLASTILLDLNLSYHMTTNQVSQCIADGSLAGQVLTEI